MSSITRREFVKLAGAFLTCAGLGLKPLEQETAIDDTYTGTSPIQSTFPIVEYLRELEQYLKERSGHNEWVFVMHPDVYNVVKTVLPDCACCSDPSISVKRHSGGAFSSDIYAIEGSRVAWKHLRRNGIV